MKTAWLKQCIATTATGFILAAGAQSVRAEQTYTHTIPAQRLVESTVAENRDLLDVILHVTPPDSTENIAVAAYTAKERGGKSGKDDLGVMQTGKPLVEVQKDGVRIGVLVQLRDRKGHPIGALGVMYPFHAGEDQQAFLKRSEAIRDRMAKQIGSREALFQKD